MISPDVAISGWLLAGACAVLVVLTLRAPGPLSALRGWFVVVLAGAGLAALMGGTIRGFYAFPTSATVVPGDAPGLFKALWSIMGIAIGAIGLARLEISARLLVPAGVARRSALGALAVLYGLYAVYVAAAPREYSVSIAAYLPPTVLLMAALAWRAAATRAAGALAGVVGLLTTFIAAAQLQLQIGVHAVYFNHNAVHHVIQGLGLFLLQRCAIQLGDPAAEPATAGFAATTSG